MKKGPDGQLYTTGPQRLSSQVVHSAYLTDSVVSSNNEREAADLEREMLMCDKDKKVSFVKQI